VAVLFRNCGLLSVVHLERDAREFRFGGDEVRTRRRVPDRKAGILFPSPLGANAACYVCHIPFVKEELSKIHLRAEVACIDCHGLSAGHANDEEIGATPPDVTFKRSAINGFCRKCHKTHDVPARKVVEAWKDGKVSEADAVCTDCHGAHKISRANRESGKGGKGDA